MGARQLGSSSYFFATWLYGIPFVSIGAFQPP
jgi:hypothetical protein